MNAELTGKAYHMGCFKCKKCQDLLMDFIYYARDAEIYCGRCHSELFVPRCAGCDEVLYISVLLSSVYRTISCLTHKFTWSMCS